MNLITILLLASAPALAQGIVFEESTFDEALAKARAGNKLLFMDCYAEWCGPCKLLSEQVFTRAEVGEYFNEHFVNLKIDMEKGEGVELAKHYAVKVYPTLLILRPDGQVQHRIVGYQDADALLARAREGSSEEGSLLHLETLYDAGNRTKGLVTRYLQALLDSHENEKAARVADDFFASLPDEEKLDTALWPLYASPEISAWGTSRFDFLRQHKPAFDRLAGKEKVDKLFYDVTTDLFMTLLFKNREGLTIAYLPEFIEALREMDFERQAIVLAEAEFTRAIMQQDVDKTVERYRQHGKEFSNKGIMNLIPLMIQNKGTINAETHPASLKLVELIEAGNK
jgi:thioredoxin-related protein